MIEGRDAVSFSEIKYFLALLNITCNRVCHLYAIKHNTVPLMVVSLSPGIILVAASHFPSEG